MCSLVVPRTEAAKCARTIHVVAPRWKPTVRAFGLVCHGEGAAQRWGPRRRPVTRRSEKAVVTLDPAAASSVVSLGWKGGDMQQVQVFEAERARLVRIAARVLADSVEAEDVVQQAWLRLHGASATIDNVPAWLTTVTVRLCLDRLRLRKPVLLAEVEAPDTASDPAEQVQLAHAVGVALQVVLDRLTPRERVAFILHDSFGFEFPAIAAALETTPAAARKLASRARGKVREPAQEDQPADWEVVDAFLAAAREGDFARLLHLLAPGAVVTADEAALLAGTPGRIDGRHEVAAFFNGAAAAALPVFIDDRPAAAWFHRGEPRVAFDFVVVEGVVSRIDFRADPTLLSAVVQRRGGRRRP